MQSKYEVKWFRKKQSVINSECLSSFYFSGYLLRRRVLSMETLTLKANDSMIVAVNWLNRTYVQLLDYCHKNNFTMPSMKYFMVKDLPLESSHQFKIWFVDLWNLVLVEQFKKELIEEVTEDPVNIISRTWPWKEQDGGFCKGLRPLTGNENSDDIFNKDPLVRNHDNFKNGNLQIR